MNRDEPLFDFACSPSYRGYESYLQGYDLQNTEPPEDAPEEKPEHYTHQPHTHSYTKRQAGRLFLKVENLETQVKSLRKVLSEMQKAKLQRGKPKYE